MDIEKKHKRIKILLTLMLAIITFAIVGFSYAYFQAQVGNASANVTVTTKTTDVLTFNKGSDITIQPTQANFGSGAGNKTGSTTVSATLIANNDTNSATQTYNVYFEIITNGFEIKTCSGGGITIKNEIKSNNTAFSDLVNYGNSYKKVNSLANELCGSPELLLTITDPSGNPVTSLTGLTYTTVNGVSGFDITTQRGLIQIASNYTITSTGTKTDTWNITVTFLNLDMDQLHNTNKKFSANVLIQKEEISTAIFDSGYNMVSKMKKLANNGIEVFFSDTDSKIKAFRKANSLPNGFSASSDNIASSSDSNNQIYIWFETDSNTNNGTGFIYYYSTADIVFLNSGSHEFFNNMTSLSDISGLAYLNTSMIQEMTNMFAGCTSLTDFSPITNWNVSSTRYMGGMFYNCSGLTTLDFLSNWDVLSVEHMGGMFCGCSNLSSATAINNWDVSNVYYMGNSYLSSGFWQMFYNANNVHPTFSKRAGSWNSDGSFIPIM